MPVILLALVAVGALAVAACTREVEVEKVVQQTVVVEKEKLVEKLVEKKVVETVVAIATPTPTAVGVKPKAVPEGSLTTVVAQITSGMTGWFPDCVFCASTVHVGSHEALFEGGRDAKGGLIIVPWIVESWKTAPDLTYTDFTMRKGITFNQGFGEMTAEDVAWTFNLTSTVTNKESKNDTGVQIPEFQGAEPIDKYTVRFKWSGFAAHSLPMRYTDLQEGIGTWSKKAFDQKGKEWMIANFIGTGPYDLTEWTENQVIRLKARNEHWRKVSYVADVKILAVPEATTRRAMLETGTALAGGVALKDMVKMAKTRYKIVPETNTSAFSITFGGNYWERVHFKTGAVLVRERDITKPWIGNPYEAGDELNLNTPSMEKSRKVRQALALAIDRQTIVEKIMGGLGEPHYLGSIWMDDPMFKKESAKWTIPFDPNKARQLLKEAGQDKGFKIQVYAGTDMFSQEMWEAVGNYWTTELNVTPEFDRRDYTQFRPSIVARTSKQVFSGCCYGPAMWPNEWTLNSANDPGGYNVGMEIPIAAATEKVKGNDPDIAKVEVAAHDVLKFLHDQWLWPGLVQYPGGAIYDPKALEWEYMRPFQWMRMDGLRSFEYVKLK